MTDEIDIDYIKTKSAIVIQDKIRHTNLKINEYNSEIKKNYSHIINVVNRIQNNYDIGLLTQSKYNTDMDKAEQLLDRINSHPSELTIKTFKNYSFIELKTTVFLIKNEIIKLMCNAGTSNIFEIFILIVGKQWRKYMSESKAKYCDLLNNIFVPTSCKINRDSRDKNTKIKIKSSNVINSKSSIIEKTDGAIIEIPFKSKTISIYGYFKKDPLNTFHKFKILFSKCNKIIDIMKKKSEINSDFVKAYIKQISTRDLIVLTTDKITSTVQNDFNYLNKLKSQTLSLLVKDFLMGNLQNQRKILTLFLISPNVETQHLAYLLYDMVSSSSDSLKPQFMAENIYKSLHWSVQKLFKIAFNNVKDYRKKLLDISDENISYEDRILQMKSSKYVKSKAMEKFREIRSGKDSTKAQRYLDGILKIPFGHFKKEKILTFLSDYSNNLKTFFNDITSSTDEIKQNDNTLKYICSSINKIINKYSLNISSYDTENQIDILIQNIEDALKNINIDLKKPLYNKKYIVKNNSYNSLKKLESIKKIKIDIDNCKQSENLDKVNNIINHKIKNELIKYSNHLHNINNFKSTTLTSKLIEMSSVTIGENDIEYNVYQNDEFEQSTIDHSKEFNKWLSIECQFMNLINEWVKYKHSKKTYMLNSKKILNKCVYGQDDAKRHIERLIAQWINGKMEGNVFGLQGPPGVGKTTLCRQGLSKCLVDDDGNSRPFAFLALGGSSNASFLVGHSYTYVGSTWGRIIDILIETKCMNPVIYIDELDKVSETERGREIIGILTHLTDPSQNAEFSDKYFAGIKFNLSKALIAFSYNDSSQINPILRDRITEVKVKSITKKEKLYIVKHYLMPEILEIVGYKKGDIIIGDNEINYIIENYTYEAGVRKLKERLFELLREINLLRILGTEKINLPFAITEKFIKDKFSDKPTVQYKKIAKEPEIGLVNGLYATSVGTGGITIIEVMKTPSDTRLSLELTGKQGKVMQESMKCAKTIAWNLLPNEIKKDINVESKECGSFGLHIHCPEAATPKDGPSAGIAITTAILSRLCKVKVLNTIAMTGEIDLNGKVHAIGGLESKLTGAKRAGVTKVLIPEENEDDYNKFLNSFTTEAEKENFIENFEIITVANIEQVMSHSLVKSDLEFNFY
jgi:endopeptidase La